MPYSAALPSPCCLVDQEILRRQLAQLRAIQRRCGCKILLAAPEPWRFLSHVRSYLAGASVASLPEARLAGEQLGGELHLVAPECAARALSEQIVGCSHLYFDSVDHWLRCKPIVRLIKPQPWCGLRLMVHCTEGNPLAESLNAASLEGIEGIYLHHACSQVFPETVQQMFTVLEERLAPHWQQLRWINLGRGHQLTNPDYDTELLCRIIERFRNRYGVTIYLEADRPLFRAACSLGVTVLEVGSDHGQATARIDVSMTRQFPAALGQPPRIAGGVVVATGGYRVRGYSDDPGDQLGHFTFAEPLQVGQRLILEDFVLEGDLAGMAVYLHDAVHDETHLLSLPSLPKRVMCPETV